MTPISGKAIYTPQGRAQEYAPVACNFFTGCSNDCSYCYCKKGFLGRIWTNKPQLKKAFRNEEHAAQLFENDIIQNQDELRKKSILFSFTTDPLLPETAPLTIHAMIKCAELGIPVHILTKRPDIIELGFVKLIRSADISFGISLTGDDEKEPNAMPTSKRIEYVKYMYMCGAPTIVSLEPIINFSLTLSMIERTLGYVDLYKIGLLSGDKPNFFSLYKFVEKAGNMIREAKSHVYWKNNIKNIVTIFPNESVVDQNFDVFENKILHKTR